MSDAKGLKVFLKRKDNNKKSVEIVVDLNAIALGASPARAKQTQPKNINEEVVPSTNKKTKKEKEKYCYICVEGQDKESMVIKITNNNKSGKGKKLIFPFPEKWENLDVQIILGQEEILEVALDCTEPKQSLNI